MAKRRLKTVAVTVRLDPHSFEIVNALEAQCGWSTNAVILHLIGYADAARRNVKPQTHQMDHAFATAASVHEMKLRHLKELTELRKNGAQSCTSPTASPALPRTKEPRSTKAITSHDGSNGSKQTGDSK